MLSTLFVTIGVVFFVMLSLFALTYGALLGWFTPNKEQSEPPSSISLPKGKDSKIAIIGAGIAGVVAARELKKRGYQHVVLYEKNEKPGGKISSIEVDGFYYDQGAIMVLQPFQTIGSLAWQLGVPLSKTLTKRDIFQDGKRFPREDYIKSKYNYSRLDILKAIVSLAWLRFRYPEVADLRYHNTSPDLAVNMDVFLKKHPAIEPVMKWVEMISVSAGYGQFRNVPAICYLKSAFYITRSHSKKVLKKGVYHFKGGYHRLIDALAQDLDIRLGTAVEAVYRTEDSDKVEVLVDGLKEVYDFLIVASPLNTASAYLDCSIEEKTLFEKYRTVNYYSFVFDAPGLDTTCISIRSDFDEDPNNKMIMYGRKHLEAKDTFIAYMQVDPESSSDFVEQCLRDDVAKQGAEITKIHSMNKWDYFPHFETSSILTGAYAQLEKLQTKKNTLYIGSSLVYEIAEAVAADAMKTVEKYFPPIHETD